MAFTAKDVAALREKTGCGMMDCKRALTEADGDEARAIELLREKGLAAAEKKAGRIAAEGVVTTYVDNAKKVGVIIEVNSETDFVAKNEKFMEFVMGAAKAVADYNPADVEALLACKFGDSEFTVAQTLTDKILTIGENMNIRRFERLEGFCGSYVHGGGTDAALILIDAPEFTDAVAEMGKNVGMQIVAMTPAYLSEAEVPASVVEEEKQILLAQIKNDPKTANKPDAVIEKMVSGKINKYYKENCLLKQEYVKDTNMTVEQYVKSVGADISILKFINYKKGEGLQKREDNFAEEVANMTK